MKTGKKSRFESTSFWIYNDFLSETVYYNDQKDRKQSKVVVINDRNNKPKKVTLTPAQKLHNRQTLETVEILRSNRFKDLVRSDIYNDDEIKAFQLGK
jgi:hypothetical protein